MKTTTIRAASSEEAQIIAFKTTMTALPAKHFERCNDWIYTRDFISFYMENGTEIKNVLYLMDIQRYYVSGRSH